MLRQWIAAGIVSFSAMAMAQSSAPIRIGVVGPFTGKSSTDMGESIRDGGRVFAAEANRVGLLLGRKIELVERDDRALPEVGEQVVKELIEKEKVVAVVGFANLGVAVKVAPLFQQAKIPLIVSAAAGGEITKQPKLASGEPNYIFRLAGRDALQTLAMFKDIVDRRKITAVAILHDATPYGESGKANALAELDRRNLKPVAVESFNIGDQDMSAQLAKARAAGAKAIAVYGLAAEDAMVAKTLAKMNWKVPLVGTWTMSQKSFIDLAGAAAEGTRSTVTFIEDEWRGPRHEFGVAYRHLNKVTAIPSAVAGAQTYDALHLLYLAIFQANSTRGEAIQHALEDLNIPARSTVVTRYSRPFAYDDHEAIGENMVVMAEVRNQKLVYAYPEDEGSALITRVRQ